MIVVDHNFVLSIPANLDLAAATPLLCAGITVVSRLYLLSVPYMFVRAVVLIICLLCFVFCVDIIILP